MKNKSAFTIMELMVVIIIIGVICAFAIPNFNKTLQTANERQAIQSLALIRDARKLYVAKFGAQMPLPLNNAQEINQALNLNLMPGDLSLFCNDDPTYLPPSGTYQCMAVSPSGWALHFEDYNGGLPPGDVIHCMIGGAYTKPCPTCPSSWYVGCAAQN